MKLNLDDDASIKSFGEELFKQPKVLDVLVNNAGFMVTGIAMGNAPGEVKAHANYITLDNDSNGILFALEQFIP